MFQATKPFNDKITNYPKEPSLRIGRCVPKNAVNLAYYYNPTATDAEKILAAEAPRQIIDHRIEEAYRYLFNQASNDDDLFPASVWYSDEEGYQGRLRRVYVNWYPKGNVEQKSITQDKTQIVIDKSEVLKMIEYSDKQGFVGNLYLDAVNYTVTKTKNESTQEELDRAIYNHELNYHEIYGNYLSSTSIDAWAKNNSNKWPSSITFTESKMEAVGGEPTVSNFVNKQPHPYDNAYGVLMLDNIEYEPVLENFVSDNNSAGTQQWFDINGKFIFKNMVWDNNDSTDVGKTYVKNIIKTSYASKYNSSTGVNDYTDIQAFLSMANTYGDAQWKSSNAKQVINAEVLTKKKGIIIVLKSATEKAVTPNSDTSQINVECTFRYILSDNPSLDEYDLGMKYNCVANYSGVLKKKVSIIKEIPAEYTAECIYTGIVRKAWNQYDGIAYYRGSVTKGNAIGNINPDKNNELLMYPDDNGYLRIPIVDKDGITRNFYRVESDFVYITDVFKDGVACFYKYPLKQPIYDYRGPDDNGFYNGNAVKIFTSTLKDIPSEYKHTMKLKPGEEEKVNIITSENGKFVERQITKAKKYYGELFTSFISSSTDTFKIVYNAFDDNDENNIALENGVQEEVYNYPFMYRDIDFTLESIDKSHHNSIRINKIKLTNPNIIKDTRRYITFDYFVRAEHKETGAIVESSTRSASILNRDYITNCEENKFVGRGMIISPFINGIYYSPADLILYDQTDNQSESIIKRSNTNEFVFSVHIANIAQSNRGGVNLICAADGSGLLLAETTIDTGFFDKTHGTYTKKLLLNNPYLVENGNIYTGYKVKCVDSRYIKVLAPREEGLLESWHPRIQFGHYSQILDQYSTHTKICYTMPEYDTQHYSKKYGQPYVDVSKERVEILNSHMVRTKCYPLFIKDINLDKDTYIYENKIYKVFKQKMSWNQAQAFCKNIGGNLAMPKNSSISSFISDLAAKYEINNIWLGATDKDNENTWKWIDGTTMTFTNWADGEPNNLGDEEHYLMIYTSLSSKVGQWNDLHDTSDAEGFVCEFNISSTIKLYKQVDDELFEVKIRDISFSDGIIITQDAISENDKIICDYTYIEESYVYRGFWKNKKDFGRLDVNPNQYHTYSDLTYTPSETKPTKNLFNKVIYFFMKPSAIYEVSDVNDDLIFENNDTELGKLLEYNEETLYHQIDNPIPAQPQDVYIGSIYIRQNTSLHSTVLVDSRTRGGGILSSMPDSLRQELEPESDYYLDIGYYDGKPYQENGVIIVRLDNRILKEFGGRFTPGDVETKVKRWLGLGIYPIIEYVNAYDKHDMPQYNLQVEDEYTNINNNTPLLALEYLKVDAEYELPLELESDNVQ